MLDAAPLIGFFYSRDTYHKDCTKGFERLVQSRTALITPLPIVFEVYKWLLHRNRQDIAQHALETMIGELQILTTSEQDFKDVQNLILDLNGWKGSLEDATVVLTAILYGCPVWTYNFRDFVAFPAIQLWNP